MAAIFADDIFKCDFLNENILIASEMSLKCVPKGPIKNIPTLGLVGPKSLSEPVMAKFTDAYMRNLASMS